MSSLTPVRCSRLVQREKERKREKEKKKLKKDEVRLFVLAVREFSMQQVIIFAAGYIENE